MKRASMLVLAASVATPALAQHQGHVPPPVQQTSQEERAAAADPHAGHTMPPPAPVPPNSQPAGVTNPDPHAGHAMPVEEASADPHAGHVMPEQGVPSDGEAADPHAGHAMPAQEAATEQPADPHAGHNMTSAQPTAISEDPHAGHVMAGEQPAAAIPAGPPPPQAFSGPEHAADLFYAEPAMVDAREELLSEHGNIPAYRILLDRLEARMGDGADGYAWDAEAWYGGDSNKLWLTSEGEGTFGERVEGAEVQALWSRALDPWFDLQLGVRQDFSSGPDRTHLVAGVQGLAPYWFEVEAMAFVSNKGEVSARFEAEYDLRLTQTLILQPAAEFDIALQNSPEIGVGSGLSSAEIGARLRYELYPQTGPAGLAPYIGVHYERAFGRTAGYLRGAGDEVGGWSILAGLRTWF